MAIGQPLPRVDGPPKVAGLTRYVADLTRCFGADGRAE